MLYKGNVFPSFCPCPPLISPPYFPVLHLPSLFFQSTEIKWQNPPSLGHFLFAPLLRIFSLISFCAQILGEYALSLELLGVTHGRN